MTPSGRTVLLLFVLLGAGAIGCGRKTPEPEPAPGTPAVAEPEVERTSVPIVEPTDPTPPAVPAPPAARLTGYADALRTRLLAGEATAVRESLPPGAMAAVGALRRALARADPAERAASLRAVGTIADLLDRQRRFLLTTEAVRQGTTPGVDLPGWVAPLLRAVAAGPAASEEPAALTDAALLDGAVAALLDDPAFRAGLERWRVTRDAPAVPPAPEGGDDPDADVVDVVTLTNPEGEEATVPLVASDGFWIPAVVEATAPTWAAKADSAGGTGAAAVLAAAGPHLEDALAADSQEQFDAALRAATSAALAAAADPPAPVPEDQRVTVDLTRPLTARQVADLLAVMEAATDDPTRAVSRAAPRSAGPGWRVSVGPVGDVAAWLARVPPLAGAAVEGRTVTLALEPPPAAPAPEPATQPAIDPADAAGVEAGEPGGAD